MLNGCVFGLLRGLTNVSVCFSRSSFIFGYSRQGCLDRERVVTVRFSFVFVRENVA